MAEKMQWKRQEDFFAELKFAPDSRVYAMRDWAAQGEARVSSGGRHNNPKARREWKELRAAADAEIERRSRNS